MCRMTIVFIAICSSVFTSCSTGESKSEYSISGVYVREYSKEILHQLNGSKVGITTFRDTIRISESGEGSYHVVNTKWRMNDYDQDGWRDMKHGENRPLPEFDASYDESSKRLNPKTSGIVPPLHVDQGQLSVGEKSKIPYVKID